MCAPAPLRYSVTVARHTLAGFTYTRNRAPIIEGQAPHRSRGQFEVVLLRRPGVVDDLRGLQRRKRPLGKKAPTSTPTIIAAGCPPPQRCA